MKRLIQLLVVVTPLILASAVQAQQPGGGRGGRGGALPEPPKNLQILPKDIPRNELIATMGAFTRGLGVQCSYCHIRPETDNGREDMERSFEKVLEIDPQNQNARRQLDQLKAQP